MKKSILYLLVLVLVLSHFTACRSAEPTNDPETDSNIASGTDGEETSDADSDTQTSQVTEEGTTGGETTGAETSSSTEPETNPPDNNEETEHMLNGKKFLFIGNSHTYYGKTVLEKSNTVLTQSARSNDKGYFYQICKNNGAEVSVTNWTFGNHTLKDFFGVCGANRACDGEKHADYLTDKNFDYVIIQEGTSEMTASELLASVKLVTDTFTAVNPDVKIVFLVSRRVHEYNRSWLGELKTLDANGIIVVDWGALVDDVIMGKTTVPGATLTYNQNSFIISKSASDGYHPNMLTGYITSLMTYCAITGESAVGQEYSFCGMTSVNSAFSFNAFIRSYYTYNNAKTNFKEIFTSAADMAGIQQLIDTYLTQKPYLN